MWGAGRGLPGPPWAPGGFGQEGTACGRRLRWEHGCCWAPAHRVCELRGGGPRAAACSRVLCGTGRGLGAKTALLVAETVTRVHSTLLPGKWVAVCFQNSLLFLFLDDCFSQMSKK